MATLALGAVGAAVGSTLLPAGISILGTTIGGAAIGSQFGALAGRYVDQALFATSGGSRIVDGPRLSDLRVLASTEGAPIPRLYGRACLGGQVIWACNLTEVITPRGSSSTGMGKGTRGGASGVDYTYFADFAVALCEGEIAGIGRVWADGSELELSQYTTRVYQGTETQQPDALIAAKQSATNTPAYLGVAYVVFEHFPLATFGNRIPQLAFEVFRPIDRLTQQIKGVCLIPGSGEFVLAPDEVSRSVSRIETVAENVHTQQGVSDWTVALDQLQSTLPNAKSVSLVVSWFGTSLDAAVCKVRPEVDSADKATSPDVWSVSNLTRTSASVVSTHNGTAAYGGTPSDKSVIAAIRDLRSRGLSPILSLFILMDIASDNTLPDPYSSATSQPAYPWRGRITVSPAAGRPGSIDKTAAATAAIAAFVGTATPAHFALDGDAVVYSGPAEFSFRRMILHNAMLAKAAGGVDAFVLCSELRGLTQVRSSPATYPFVDALIQLAADVRTILGATTKIVYAADWTEYFGHQPADGSGDVFFHLDPLWSSPAIDAIGIDCYWPLADWRDGSNHLDRIAGAASIYDQSYLKSNLAGGEGYAWYYASAADRDAQRRLPITDGLGKPWVFRSKDLASWWSSQHFNRPGGIESTAPTAWVPQSKPVWFMELGCPAIDKGANQPNVFVDPKSAESAVPYYSSRARDDTMQRSYLQAFHDAFDPASPSNMPGLNPISAVYGAPMLDVSRLHVYCWDARSYPAFPDASNVWGDSANWTLGHWITGRIASVSIATVLQRLAADFAFPASVSAAVSGTLPGYVLDRIMSARDAIQPLELAFFFDSLETEGTIAFRPRAGSATALAFDPATVVETNPSASLTKISRAQETDLPASAKISYVSTADQYPSAVAEARRIAGGSRRISTASLPMVLEPDAATAIADAWLFESWAARETASFTLPPSQLALEPGDTISLSTGQRSYMFRITEIGDHGARDIQALSIDLDIYAPTRAAARPIAPVAPLPSGPPEVIMLDIPQLSATDADYTGYIAAAKVPWPGSVAVWRSPDTSGFSLNTLIPTPATIGITVNDLQPGPTWRADLSNTLTVDIDSGALASVSPLQLLGGANLAALDRGQNNWELIQFQNAVLIGPGRYALTNLLRGQRGSDQRPLPTIAAGSRFVLLDGSVVPIAMTADDVGVSYNWKVGPSARALGDSSFVSMTHAFSGRGLVPLRPVQMTGSRNAAGDLILSWLRRTRIDGDNWDPVDVPLGEDAEQYQVDILANASGGAATLRTLATPTPNVIYPIAAQIADFGAAPTQVTVRIAQISRAIGPGTPSTITP